MLAAGPRATGRYTGTLLIVFVIQSLVAIACMIGLWIVLARVFSKLPLWDEAVDGDLVAMIYCIRYGDVALLASSGLVIGSLATWTLVSWFIAGGINSVLAERPDGRAETARTFGAGGASTFLAYARLFVVSLPSWVVAGFVVLVGLGIAADKTKYALTVPQLVGPLVLCALPGLLLLHIVWTVTDYARVELTLRHDSHEPSALMTYLRTLSFVLKRPRTLVHAGLGWLAFALITVMYAYFAHGHPMYGAGGAVTLFVIRQGIALARTAIRFGVIAGQVELGKTRALPPRRIEKPEKKIA